MTTSGASEKEATDASNARDLAHQLVSRAARHSEEPMGSANTAFTACQAAYRALSRSIGATGAHALLARSLAEASRAHPLLREIRVDDNGTSGQDGLKAAVESHGSPAAAAGLEALLEILLSLLGRFVGFDMVVRLVAQASTIGTKEDEDAQ
jgi:hypothetical protein